MQFQGAFFIFRHFDSTLAVCRRGAHIHLSKNDTCFAYFPPFERDVSRVHYLFEAFFVAVADADATIYAWRLAVMPWPCRTIFH